jgi:hypothetical protein
VAISSIYSIGTYVIFRNCVSIRNSEKVKRIINGEKGIVFESEPEVPKSFLNEKPRGNLEI